MSFFSGDPTPRVQELFDKVVAQVEAAGFSQAEVEQFADLFLTMPHGSASSDECWARFKADKAKTPFRQRPRAQKAAAAPKPPVRKRKSA